MYTVNELDAQPCANLGQLLDVVSIDKKLMDH